MLADIRPVYMLAIHGPGPACDHILHVSSSMAFVLLVVAELIAHVHLTANYIQDSNGQPYARCTKPQSPEGWTLKIKILDESSVELTHPTWRNPTSLCEVTPGWGQIEADHLAVNDSAIPSSRLGTLRVMGGSSQQGCILAGDRLCSFGHTCWQGEPENFNWSSVRWGALQRDCTISNLLPEAALDPPATLRRLAQAYPDVEEELQSSTLDFLHSGLTAVVLRGWDDYKYSSNQLAWLRTLTHELSLGTGGKFQVFLLVNVKDNSLNLSDDSIHTRILDKSIPEEFHDTTLLYNEPLLRAWFPKVGEYGAQDQMYQALQIFSLTYPEFDFIWQLEMDARFTSNAADMFTNAASWAKSHPRKNLWERNAQFFVPGLEPNTSSSLYSDDGYPAFSTRVDSDIPIEAGIWGPHPHASFFLDPQGPAPPSRSSPEADVWGVGEEAELITFSPIIDPVNTEWVYEHTVRNFPHPLSLPRRMAIVSMTRTSRRLLRLVSMEQRMRGGWVVSEATPETFALLHGLKAVFVPHLVAFKFEDGGGLGPKEMDEMVHKGPEWNKAGGEHAGFLWCANGVGLPEGRWRAASYFFWGGIAEDVWKNYTQGGCIPPMLLHPVKND